MICLSKYEIPTSLYATNLAPATGEHHPGTVSLAEHFNNNQAPVTYEPRSFKNYHITNTWSINEGPVLGCGVRLGWGNGQCDLLTA
ncbi:hypothetical protein J6590_061204 [Homalodisca vitripennis]|nr:hypothetical protein J6590_061204 [Homalodisca vitripennis]